MKNDFTYVFRVRYSECDPQKVVFNGRYAEYVDLAATEFVKALWGSYDNVIAKGFDFQVVNLNISWKAPAHFDDVITVSVKTSHVGNSSYIFSYEFFNKTTNQNIVTAEAVYVMVDANSFTKITIPDDLRATLEAGAPGVVVNHAGVTP